MSKSKSTSPPIQTSKLNAVNSSSSQQSGGKKKNAPAKGKNKQDSKQWETMQTQEPTSESKPKRKVEFQCMIFGEDH